MNRKYMETKCVEERKFLQADTDSVQERSDEN
jgi:hypothetical protein